VKILGLRNNKTGEVIYSRANHDFHSDTTNEIFVDGGFDYFRCLYNENANFSKVEFDLNVTKQELYEDWNSMKDKYGRLSKEQIEKQKILIQTIDKN
jgi:hypothetical protein